MKNALLLLLILSPLASAQTVYRCETGFDSVSYQDTPCGDSTHASSASLEQPIAREDNWNRPQDHERRRQAVAGERAEALRVRRRFNPALGHREAVHAASRSRCEDALTVAAFCGRRDGTFSCDEKGFRMTPREQVEPVSSRAFRQASTYSIEQCELQARAFD